MYSLEYNCNTELKDLIPLLVDIINNKNCVDCASFSFDFYIITLFALEAIDLNLLFFANIDNFIAYLL